MSAPVITVDNLGKKYRLGVAQHDTLRDRIVHSLRSPFRRSGGNGTATADDFWALRDVSFEVRRGEVLGIIGRNGAGKSTLLKILSRITEPTQGRISLRGRVASLLEVGTGFHPELSGRENIFLNGAILGMTRAEIRRKFDEIVAFAEVERFLDTPVKHYSSGMYVRLAFAVAAHLEPEILIIDEVLAVGDAEFQAKCLGKMETIAESDGRTILFVSHNMSAVAQFCHRAVLLDHGVVRLDASAEEAIDGYLCSRTAGRTGTIALPAKGREEGSPITLLSLSINHSAPAVHRGEFAATVRFHASRPVDGVGFGIGFCGVDGRRILTCDSDYAREYFRVDSAGEHEVRLTLPVLDLVPTRYRIDVGAFSSTRASFHYAPDCAAVDVQPGSDTPAFLHGLSGEFRPNASWRLGRG